jgi:hypothetical protein
MESDLGTRQQNAKLAQLIASHRWRPTLQKLPRSLRVADATAFINEAALTRGFETAGMLVRADVVHVRHWEVGTVAAAAFVRGDIDDRLDVAVRASKEKILEGIHKVGERYPVVAGTTDQYEDLNALAVKAGKKGKIRLNGMTRSFTPEELFWKMLTQDLKSVRSYQRFLPK